MQRHHTGSGRRPVVSEDWAAHHRPAAAGSFTADVAIRPPGTRQMWDTATEQNVLLANDPTFEGRGRAQSLTGSDQASADDVVGVVEYLVVVEVDAVVSVGDLVSVSGSGDPVLDDGPALVVRRVVGGSSLFQRDLYCRTTA